MGRGDGIPAFFALACGLTWLLDTPLVWAWTHHREPAAWALALAGLSAFGPTLAAVALAAPRGELGLVFGRWRANPLWVVLALFTPMFLHFPATMLDALLGGEPAQWLYLPDKPERILALVFFSIGEEFGWRGFAQPRMAARFGPVRGSLLLGMVWALWHAMMVFTPAGAIDWQGAAFLVITLPLWSVVMAWFLARGGGSLAVAIALHAGGHLDNNSLAPASAVQLRVLTVLVLAVASGLAARSLARDRG